MSDSHEYASAPLDHPLHFDAARDLERALFEVKRVIVGQHRLVESVLVALLARATACSRACPASPRP